MLSLIVFNYKSMNYITNNFKIEYTPCIHNAKVTMEIHKVGRDL